MEDDSGRLGQHSHSNTAASFFSRKNEPFYLDSVHWEHLIVPCDTTAFMLGKYG